MAPHDPEIVRHVVEQAHWWDRILHEIITGAGVLSLLILKFIGSKELERRKEAEENFVTSTEMNSCGDRIVQQINEGNQERETRMEARIDRIEDQVNLHINNCGGKNGESTD